VLHVFEAFFQPIPQPGLAWLDRPTMALKDEILFLLLVLLLAGCDYKHERSSKCQSITASEFTGHLHAKYPEYIIRKVSDDLDDYIANYAAFCHVNTGDRNIDYKIVQNNQIFKIRNGVYKNVLSYELFTFKKSNVLTSVIEDIKRKNCIDDNVLKIHTIYRIGENTIACVNFYDFPINSFEDFLSNEFACSIRKYVISSDKTNTRLRTE
jgi:hypothetical protein